MSDYARAELVGPAEALVLEAGDTELLVASLGALCDVLEDVYARLVLDDAAALTEATALGRRIDAIAELRDAIDTAVKDPEP